MKYNIYFIKTAKCATESIKHYLIQYAIYNKLYINNDRYGNFFHNNQFNINTNHIFADEKSLNHFYNSIDKSLPVLKISSVRHPLTRLYSHYCYGHPYFKKGMDFNEWYIKTIKKIIPDNWVASKLGDKTTNYMWDYMGITSLDNIKEKYDFIFVKENFEKSLTKFENILNFKFERLDELKNSNSKSHEDYVFDSDVIELFNENNQKDLELYDYVLKNY